MSPPFTNPEVEAVFALYPVDLRPKLLQLRDLIHEVADSTPGVGRLVETLKWGQPAYLTEKPKTGTTVRLHTDSGNGGDIALYVPCTTSLIDTWRERYPQLVYGGTRSVHFRRDAALPEDELRHCIAMAMTYHLPKSVRRTD